jgi:predicted lipoprotein with Yx(FWY)xxD motif
VVLRSLVPGRRSWVALAGAVLLVAGCGASGGSPTASAPAPEASGPAASEAAGEEYVINVATDPTLGDILVGEDGKTLYVFTKDSGGKSACNGDCATSWPPFVLEEDEEVVAGDGVTGALATIARDDGSLQVTYAGAPLYYFANDAAAGDVKGQGINDVWFVATPSGTSGSSGGSGTGGDEYSSGGSNPTATP